MGQLNIIAEIGSNWAGDKAQIIPHIEEAARCGCTGVKFQIGLDRLYASSRAPQIAARVAKYAFPLAELPKYRQVAHRCGLELWASVFDVRLLEEEKVALYLDGLKIASGDITYRPLVESCARWSRECQIPLAISTGAALENEIEQTLAWTWGAYRVILMQCNSEYPAFPENANLAALLPYQ